MLYSVKLVLCFSIIPELTSCSWSHEFSPNWPGMSTSRVETLFWDKLCSTIVPAEAVADHPGLGVWIQLKRIDHVSMNRSRLFKALLSPPACPPCVRCITDEVIARGLESQSLETVTILRLWIDLNSKSWRIQIPLVTGIKIARSVRLNSEPESPGGNNINQTSRQTSRRSEQER